MLIKSMMRKRKLVRKKLI